jgi:ornithine cyclodeaminase/alanine dehydrogenase-like protein (mu-crystallin family)
VTALWVAEVKAGLARAGRRHGGAFIDAQEAKRRLPLADAVGIVRDAVLWEASGRILMPDARRAALRYTAPGDGLRVAAVSKCCVIPDLDLAAFRFLGSVLGDDPVRFLHLVGLERRNLLAAIDEHLTYLVRIAALALVVAEHTVPARAPVIGMIGAGRLARAVLGAFIESGRAGEIVVASRRPASRDRLVHDLAASGFPRVTAADSAREAAGRADFLVTATDAASPILSAAWVKPGATVYGLGDAVELADDLLVRRERGPVRLVVANWLECAQRADFRRLIDEGRIAESDVDAELSDVISGAKPARVDPRGVVCVRAPGSVALDALLGAWICARRALTA